jgi:broad specificity phosphatase PhoE
MIFTLIRHGHCEKNIADVIGGKGAKLTTLGQAQAKSCGTEEVRQKPKNPIIFSTDILQATETATIISKEIICPVIVWPDLAPLHLGVLANIPSELAKTRYPDDYVKLANWKNGTHEISETTITGMGNVSDFYKNGLIFLSQLIDTHSHNDIYIVSTRSILILLHNILLMRDIQPGNGYKNIDYENCSPKKLSLDHEVKQWIHGHYLIAG